VDGGRVTRLEPTSGGDVGWGYLERREQRVKVID